MLKTTKAQKARLEIILAGVLAQGFDRSYRSRDMIRVKCGQCEACVINGLPTHEHGCVHGRGYKCRECGEQFATIEQAFYCCEPAYVGV